MHINFDMSSYEKKQFFTRRGFEMVPIDSRTIWPDMQLNKFQNKNYTLELFTLTQFYLFLHDNDYHQEAKHDCNTWLLWGYNGFSMGENH